MHISVLSSEILSCFSSHPIRVFVDGTLGAGGHAAALLASHPEIKLYIGIDQDPTALEISRQRLAPWKDKVRFIKDNFSNLFNYLPELQVEKVDGILLDLGVSSMQLEMPEKGFSFMRSGPLDMRMDPSQPLTAAEIINQWPEEELGRIFRDLGEEKQWRKAAKTIAEARQHKAILTTKDLAEVLQPVLFFKKKGINPLTLIFQALRIQVNRELEHLENFLPPAVDLLSTEGRLAVISFHSLEDRIIKNAFRFAASDKYETTGLGGLFRNKEPLAKIITKKPIIPSDEEIESNPRSRSAKLRVLEKF